MQKVSQSTSDHTMLLENYSENALFNWPQFEFELIYHSMISFDKIAREQIQRTQHLFVQLDMAPSIQTSRQSDSSLKLRTILFPQ